MRSQKTKLTPLELIFQTAGAINPPPPTRIGYDRVRIFETWTQKWFFLGIFPKISVFPNNYLHLNVFRSHIENHASNCTEDSSSTRVSCPICSQKFPASTIETHAAECGLWVTIFLCLRLDSSFTTYMRNSRPLSDHKSYIMLC